MQTFRIADLTIAAAPGPADRICFILSPFDSLEGWADEAAETFGVTMAVVTGMDWDNDLTPWPAKGEPPGCPDFSGNAPDFLATLKTKVVPETERRLGITEDAERTLAGVSLSGLFTLWQWMLCDTFCNIISLSGSFWYDGFAEWIKQQTVPKKNGKAYFLLGNLEAKTNIKAFQPVQKDTEEITSYLHDNGICECFELVPGNHYQYALQRLNRAFTWMFLHRQP